MCSFFELCKVNNASRVWERTPHFNIRDIFSARRKQQSRPKMLIAMSQFALSMILYEVGGPQGYAASTSQKHAFDETSR